MFRQTDRQTDSVINKTKYDHVPQSVSPVTQFEGTSTNPQPQDATHRSPPTMPPNPPANNRRLLFPPPYSQRRQPATTPPVILDALNNPFVVYPSDTVTELLSQQIVASPTDLEPASGSLSEISVVTKRLNPHQNSFELEVAARYDNLPSQSQSLSQSHSPPTYQNSFEAETASRYDSFSQSQTVEVVEDEGEGYYGEEERDGNGNEVQTHDESDDDDAEEPDPFCTASLGVSDSEYDSAADPDYEYMDVPDVDVSDSELEEDVNLLTESPAPMDFETDQYFPDDWSDSDVVKSPQSPENPFKAREGSCGPSLSTRKKRMKGRKEGKVVYVL
ncbi:hypothetical protein BC938DRAFT_483223 [Jimgerdemannia flammicorona]|uniref:Uncharacterized protein n=1 Tax=Jimgerdemannia flammicorona TaxID=994334 RepID=A0A433QCD0_9FUNG|nr:hypothetical protein BC938DRAFT_483223 [Jimgerdemannia flammicorona]